MIVSRSYHQHRLPHDSSTQALPMDTEQRRLGSRISTVAAIPPWRGSAGYTTAAAGSVALDRRICREGKQWLGGRRCRNSSPSMTKSSFQKRPCAHAPPLHNPYDPACMAPATLHGDATACHNSAIGMPQQCGGRHTRQHHGVVVARCNSPPRRYSDAMVMIW